MNTRALTGDGRCGMEGQSPGGLGLGKEEEGFVFEWRGREREVKDIC